MRVDEGVTPTMRRSLMYKACYYRYNEVYHGPRDGYGFDRARNQAVKVRFQTRGRCKLVRNESIFPHVELQQNEIGSKRRTGSILLSRPARRIQ